MDGRTSEDLAAFSKIKVSQQRSRERPRAIAVLTASYSSAACTQHRASLHNIKKERNRNNSGLFRESTFRKERRESSMKSLAMKDLPVDMLKGINTNGKKNSNILLNVKIPDTSTNKKVMMLGVNLSRFVIPADANWKSRWDWFVIYLVIYTAVFIPYSFSFQHNKIPLQEALDYLIDLIFIVDIVFSFFTAYFDKRGDEIQDIIAIRKRYLGQWFIIDLVAAFPFELCARYILGLKMQMEVLNLFKVPRLLRLVRLMKKLDQLASANAFRIVKLLCGFALFTHWIACVWYFIGRFQDEGNIWTGSVWLVKQNLCQTVKGPGNYVDGVYVETDINEVGTKYNVSGVVACIDEDEDAVKQWRVDDFVTLYNSATCLLANESLIATPEFCNDGVATITPDATPFTKYIASFYWALTTLTTVGYGDIQPQTNTERTFVVFVMLGGALMYASIFGNVAVLIQTFDAANSRYKEKLDQLKEFATYYDLEEKLHAKLNKYIQKHQQVTNGLDCESFLNGYPVSVRGDIAVAMREKFVAEVKKSNPYMAKADYEVFLKAMLSKMRPQICLRHDYILRKGEVGKEMYFIARGCVGVLATDLPSKPSMNNNMMDEFETGSIRSDVSAMGLATPASPASPASPGTPANKDFKKKGQALKNAVAVKLGPGEHFGEMALFDEERWGASVVALSFCELHILNFYDFKELERDYTAEMRTMRKFAETRNKSKSDSPIVEVTPGSASGAGNKTPGKDQDGKASIGAERPKTPKQEVTSENDEKIMKLESRLKMLESRIASRAERLEEQLIRIISSLVPPEKKN